MLFSKCKKEEWCECENSMRDPHAALLERDEATMHARSCINHHASVPTTTIHIHLGHKSLNQNPVLEFPLILNSLM